MNSTPHIIGILPARFASTRFPGKPLHILAGRPLIQHVYERCQECKLLDEIIIATDDARIADCAKSFGAKVAMTSENHPTGTDRIAEATKEIPHATHIINIQGDEPLISPLLIDQLAQALIDDENLPMVTAANAITNDADFHDPNVVKIILDQKNYVIYCSRSPIPYQRVSLPNFTLLRHKGIYGYRRDFLEQFVTWAPTPLEQIESLEQLRAIENGAKIKVIITDDDSIGLDTPAQANIIESILLSKTGVSPVMSDTHLACHQTNNAAEDGDAP